MSTGVSGLSRLGGSGGSGGRGVAEVEAEVDAEVVAEAGSGIVTMGSLMPRDVICLVIKPCNACAVATAAGLHDAAIIMPGARIACSEPQEHTLFATTKSI